MFMKPTCRTLFFTLLLSIMASGPVYSGNWNHFNNNWKFTKGNPENAQSINFDDSSWEKVNLPHDWAIKGPFNEQENGSTGKLPWRGEGWYRNTFTLSSNRGK